MGSFPTMVRAGARGLVAAMAMTGMRMVTVNLGLLERTPPEEIVDRHAPRAVRRLPAERRAAVTELAHAAFGATAGVGFAVLPTRLRAHAVTGPAYGLAVWLGFELGLAPLLGVPYVRQRRLTGRLVLALDHVLYGVVVGGRLAPDPGVIRRLRPGARAANTCQTYRQAEGKQPRKAARSRRQDR